MLGVSWLGHHLRLSLMVGASIGLAMIGACGDAARDSESDDSEKSGSAGSSSGRGGRPGEGGFGGASDGGTESGGGEAAVAGEAGRGGGIGEGGEAGNGASTSSGGSSGDGGSSGNTGSGGSAGALAGTGGMAGSGGGPIAPTGSPVALHGALHVNGRFLEDASGNSVQLKGLSGYWTNWQTFHPEQNLNALRWLRDTWGISLIRVAMGVGPETNGYLENPTLNRAAVDAVVRAAADLGLYVIIDWHDHHAHEHQAQAQAFFTSVATAYGHLPNVLYEPYNEPLDTATWAGNVKPYHEALVQSIRGVDPDNVIILGSPHWSQDVDVASLDPVSGTNLMYTLHFYACTHGATIRAKAEAAVANGLPLFATEWGATSVTTGQETYVCEVEADAWHDFLDENWVSSAAWSLCNLQTEANCIVTASASPSGSWDKLLRGHGPYVRDQLQGQRYDCSNPRIIDSLEDGDAAICATAGRTGAWFVTNDGTGTQSPSTAADISALLSAPRGASLRAAHASGSGFTSWGAILGVILNDGPSYPLYYDASGHAGIRFHARGVGTVRVGVTAGRTRPAPEGHCVDPGCNRPFQASVTLTSTWVPVLLRFDALRSGTTASNGAGYMTAQDQREILTIEFLASGGASFDYWIDDIGFY
jgi:endoglucanase